MPGSTKTATNENDLRKGNSTTTLQVEIGKAGVGRGAKHATKRAVDRGAIRIKTLHKISLENRGVSPTP